MMWISAECKYKYMEVEKEQTNLKQVEYKIVHTFRSLFKFVVIYHFCEHYHYYYLQVFVQFLYIRKTLNFYWKC